MQQKTSLMQSKQKVGNLPEQGNKHKGNEVQRRCTVHGTLYVHI